MKPTPRLLLLIASGALGHCAQAQNRVPVLSWGFAQGFLTTFIDVAEAASTACKPFSKASDASAALSAWIARNGPLIDAIEAAGLQGTKAQPGKTGPEYFRTMRNEQKLRILAGFGPRLSEEFCAGQAQAYREGVLELKLFPHHLRAAGVAAIKE
jgi:hypothetical protein